MSPQKTNTIFKLLSDAIPSPKSELTYKSSFQLLIAVILSAQATDTSVNRVTPELFRVGPTPETLLALGEKKIQSIIKSIGLSGIKARNIYKTCTLLVERHNSKVPDNRKMLEQLPGVGRKTAGVVLNVAFNKPEIPVDTHVFRLSNRVGLVIAKNPLQTEQQLKKIVPKWVVNNAHHLLILHGRHVCKAQKPLCNQCCIFEHCEYPDKTGE